MKAGRAAAVVARTLGFPEASLSNWVRAEGKGQLGLTAEGKPAPKVTAEQAAIARLRAEVGGCP
ncbi:transposase [Aquincola sp. J276]|uniref:transposase n=1 Tax=Aquincola sp. J276 TaxID=2898432 RepID=UPI003857A762